jgi:hypothetical protein
MLHRMALRVLPSLSLAVTEDAVRKRKRLVMLVPGLVAFGVYRLAKHALPLTEPVALLLFSGMVGFVTALSAYRVGRGAGWADVLREDGNKLLLWMAGWIGFVYAIQLSLLVLALLWLVGYDYLKHPDGPAMMAIIISCTAVARDAFEIGHVRKMAVLGRPFPTFPDGAALRALVGERLIRMSPWLLSGLLTGAAGGALGAVASSHHHIAVLVQLAAVTVLGGALALCAYFAGSRPDGSWLQGIAQTPAHELLKYWWWPGLAFASTYYLVAAGFVLFLLRQPGMTPLPAIASGGGVAGLMALYGYYLGHRRRIEELQGQMFSSALLRCPFVMGILGRSSDMTAGTQAVPAAKA